MILIFALRWISQLILLIPIKKDFLIFNKFILLFLLKCKNLILLIKLVVLVINFIWIRRFRWKFLQTMIIVRFHSLWISFKLKCSSWFILPRRNATARHWSEVYPRAHWRSLCPFWQTKVVQWERNNVP